MTKASDALRLRLAPRCGAKTRSGAPCQSPAVKGRKRCRMHGGTNTGAPKGNRNAWKHGFRSSSAPREVTKAYNAMANLPAPADLVLAKAAQIRVKEALKTERKKSNGQ